MTPFWAALNTSLLVYDVFLSSFKNLILVYDVFLSSLKTSFYESMTSLWRLSEQF